MIIKNKELKKMLKEQGKRYVLMLYTNRFIHMSEKQLDYVLEWEDGKRPKKK